MQQETLGLLMDARLLPLLIPLAVIGSNLAMAGPAENAFCDAYATAAITTVELAIQKGCVQADHGRWDLSYDQHRNVCLGWSTDPRNGGMNAMNETYWRGQQLSECLAQKAGVPPPLHFTGGDPFRGDDVPNLDDFCRGYAFTAGQQLANKFQGGDRLIASVPLCGFTGPRYAPDFDHQRLTCMSWAAQSGRSAGATSANETNARTQDIIACEVRNMATTPQPQPPSTAVTATVTTAVTMYNVCQSPNKDLCYLNPGDTLTVVQNPAPNCGDPKWIKLTGTSNQCNAQTGFVYNNGELSIP
jgi:hypothetical protein